MARDDEVIQRPDVDQGEPLLERLRERLICASVPRKSSSAARR